MPKTPLKRPAPKPKASAPAAQATNTQETPEATNRRLAGELRDALAQISAMIESRADDGEEIDDLRGIVRREHLYHKLRAEELARDLHNCGIEV
jgi:hypothetical protein